MKANLTVHRNTFNIIFWLDKRKLKSPNDEAPIYVRITVNGKRTEIFTQKSVTPHLWNSEKGQVKGNTDNARSINNRIERIRTQLVTIYDELAQKRVLITPTLIKNNYLGVEDTQQTLLKLVSFHNREMKHSLAPGTIKNYFTTEKYLQQFLKEKYKTTDLYLTQLNYKFVTDFEYWLKGLKPEGNRRACDNNTSMKHIERLRKMLNIAIKNEWIDKDPFQKFRLSFQRTSREYLTEQELENFENLILPNIRLEKVRDLFVFACYTGLSYIDVQQLTPSHLSKDIEGNIWICTSRQKTDTPVRVPLLPQAYLIMEKYREQPDLIRAGRLMPIISNQKANTYLKELAKMTNISKNLSFHLARHTFATTVTLTNGVPIESVSAMLEHTSIRTTQIYAKVVEKKLLEDMKGLREKLTNKGKKHAQVLQNTG
jgi:site-specific recombinase XerD